MNQEIMEESLNKGFTAFRNLLRTIGTTIGTINQQRASLSHMADATMGLEQKVGVNSDNRVEQLRTLGSMPEIWHEPSRIQRHQYAAYANLNISRGANNAINAAFGSNAHNLHAIQQPVQQNDQRALPNNQAQVRPSDQMQLTHQSANVIRPNYYQPASLSNQQIYPSEPLRLTHQHLQTHQSEPLRLTHQPLQLTNQSEPLRLTHQSDVIRPNDQWTVEQYQPASRVTELYDSDDSDDESSNEQMSQASSRQLVIRQHPVIDAKRDKTRRIKKSNLQSDITADEKRIIDMIRTGKLTLH